MPKDRPNGRTASANAIRNRPTQWLRSTERLVAAMARLNRHRRLTGGFFRSCQLILDARTGNAKPRTREGHHGDHHEPQIRQPTHKSAG
jgi:hypothetical protein